MTCGLYLIENKITGGYYGGSSVNIEKRWSNHKGIVRRGQYTWKSHLYDAMAKYGIDNFDWKILLICSSTDLEYYEQLWLNKHIGGSQCYNINLSAEAPRRGRFQSDEERQKRKGKIPWNKGLKTGIPAWNRGLKLGPRTKTDKEKISKKLTGKIVSKETRIKLSEIRKKRVQHRHPNFIAAGKIAAIGRKLTIEHIEKLRIGREKKLKERRNV